MDGNIVDGNNTHLACTRQIAHELLFTFGNIDKTKYIKNIYEYVSRVWDAESVIVNNGN
jgi:hypothetical protein